MKKVMFDLQKLKEMAHRVGGILVMNGNEPELVILPYEKYVGESVVSSPQPPLPVVQPAPPMTADDQVLIDALNKEISALKEEIRQRESNVELGEPREA